MSNPWFSRRILTAVAFAIVFGAACFLLGRWQLSRYEQKDARASAVEANYHRDPVPLAEVLSGPGVELAEEQVWAKVRVTGRYAGDRQMYVRGRASQGTQGYEILVPLLLDDGGVLFVDRGWVANAATAAELPPVPPAPGGLVTVTGWLKPGEDVRSQGLPDGQLGSINLDQAWAQVGQRLPGSAAQRPYAAYLVLDHEQLPGGLTPDRPAPLEAPTPDRGPHFAYALQWWLTAGLGVAFVIYLYRSRPDAVAARAQRAASAPKPKKVRIWDEEDE